jgi:hypothetical protein
MTIARGTSDGPTVLLDESKDYATAGASTSLAPSQAGRYHMDDPDELNFGFSVARDLFKEASEQTKGLARRFFQALAEDGDREKIWELIAFYSVSFGRDVDQQWMDYADQGRGVALGRSVCDAAPDFLVSHALFGFW